MNPIKKAGMSKYIKSLNSIFIIILFAIPLKAQQEILIDKVVAQVGSELILLSEVERQFISIKQVQGDLKNEAKCDILENMMAAELMVHQARLDSLEVTDEEVEMQLEARISSILQQMGGDEAFFENYYGKSVNAVRDEMREDMGHQLLAEKMQMEILNRVNITPKEVEKFFRSIPADSLPYFNAEVEIGEIVMVPTSSQEENERTIEQLEKFRLQIVNEEATFEELASRYSDDYGSARSGGDLGWQKRGSFVPEFEAIAYALEPGEISEVVESPFGYHIIQLLERRGNSIHTKHILLKPEITEADLEKTKRQLLDIKAKIESDSISFSKAVKVYGKDGVESFSNNGRMTNPMNRSTFFETKDLPPDIYFAIESMSVDSISDPMEFTTQTGETQYRIIQLQSRTRPHKANLEEDYEKIQQYAKESKKNEYFNNWIISKIGTAYTHVDPIYLACPNIQMWLKEEEK